MVKQYEIINVDLDPTRGNEKGKKRPCLIVSNTEFVNITKFAWIFPITSRGLKYPTDIELKTKENKIYGIIDCAQIISLDLQARPYEYVDTLDDPVILSIKDVVYNILGQ